MTRPTRRDLLQGAGALAAVLAVPGLLRAQEASPRHNVSGFVVQDWRDHFETLGVGATTFSTTPVIPLRVSSSLTGVEVG